MGLDLFLHQKADEILRGYAQRCDDSSVNVCALYAGTTVATVHHVIPLHQARDGGDHQVEGDFSECRLEDEKIVSPL